MSAPSEAEGEPDRGFSQVLVVDDETMSRRASSCALDISGLEVAASEDSRASLELLAKRTFNLVVLDESMPGLTGSQILARMRQGPPNQKTPVILVMDKVEFDARQNEKLPNNLDFIARPFPFSELAVKALSMMLDHQIIDIKPLHLAEEP